MKVNRSTVVSEPDIIAQSIYSILRQPGQSKYSKLAILVSPTGIDRASITYIRQRKEARKQSSKKAIYKQKRSKKTNKIK